MAVADPIQDEKSWRFTLDPDGRDPVLGIRYLMSPTDAAGAHRLAGPALGRMKE